MRKEPESAQITRRQKRGRPIRTQKVMRSKRVVTFVTESELERLEQICWDEDRSLSAVVHRIIVEHLAKFKQG